MSGQVPQTQFYTVASGTSVRIFAGDNNSFVFIPGAAGTMTVEYSADGVNFTTFTTTGTGVAASLAPAALKIGAFGVIRATATSAAGVVVVCDVSQTGYYAAGVGQILANYGGTITTPNSTSEGNVWALRLPAGILKPNFRIEVESFYTLAGAGGTKTLKVYFGNTGSGTAAFAPTAIASGAANGKIEVDIVGAGDGATVNAYGKCFAAAAVENKQVAISSNAAYQTAEQELYITCTKAAGTDTATFQNVAVKLFQ